MKKKLLGIVLILTLVLGLVGCSTKDSKKDDGGSKSEETVELNISAAASLKEAMTKIETAFKEVEPNVKLVVNLGSSGSLQQQIEQGAPCDVFISAGKKQMTALEEGDLLLEDTNKDLLVNDLVLVSSKDSKVSNLDDLKTDKVSKIAVGEPESVPAGKYADEVLTNLNLKDSVTDKLVYAKDVKEVLSWVQSGNADVGFVYLSDTYNVDNVNVVLTTPEDSHTIITYPIAVIKASKQQEKAKAFEDYLLSDDGQAILQKYGYQKVK